VFSSSNSLPPASSHCSLSPTRKFWCSFGKFYYFNFYLLKNFLILKFRKSSIVLYFLMFRLNVEVFFYSETLVFFYQTARSNFREEGSLPKTYFSTHSPIQATHVIQLQKLHYIGAVLRPQMRMEFPHVHRSIPCVGLKSLERLYVNRELWTDCSRWLCSVLSASTFPFLQSVENSVRLTSFCHYDLWWWLLLSKTQDLVD